MREELLERLRPITPEEREILDGSHSIQRERYTASKAFVVDSRRMLEKGKLIDLRLHTRFVAFPKHRHNYVEMVYQCCGHTRHILNGHEHISLAPGDLLFLNPAAYHEILPAQAGDIAVNFIILPEFFDRTLTLLAQEDILRDHLISALDGTDTQSAYLLFHCEGMVPVENLLENMIWTLLQNKSGTNTLNATSMALLFLNLSQFSDAQSLDLHGSQAHQLAFQVLRYIETHYKSGSLEEIAALLGEPVYTLSRLLKKHTGSNFKELLLQRKLQQAAYLLANTTLSIDAVMAAIGYENSSFFYRKFREKYACSPASYRQAHGLGVETP